MTIGLRSVVEPVDLASLHRHLLGELETGNRAVLSEREVELATPLVLQALLGQTKPVHLSEPGAELQLVALPALRDRLKLLVEEMGRRGIPLRVEVRL